MQQKYIKFICGNGVIDLKYSAIKSQKFVYSLAARVIREPLRNPNRKKNAEESKSKQHHEQTLKFVHTIPLNLNKCINVKENIVTC